MRGRHRPRRNYKLRIFFLSLGILAMAMTVGWKIGDYIKAPKSAMLVRLESGAIIAACVAVIYLLIWAIMIQRKKLARSRHER
jgi:hypothetical protein